MSVNPLALIMQNSDVVGTEWGPGSPVSGFNKELYSVNPILSDKDLEPNEAHPDPNSSWRRDINCTRFNSFIFESDDESISLDEQRRRCETLRDLVRQCTFSGGKSFHLVVTVADSLPWAVHTHQGIQQYKHAWEQLHNLFVELTELEFDQSTKHPSRLTRTPNVMRSSTGREQSLLYSGSFITSEFLLGLGPPITETAKIESKLSPNHNLKAEEFERLMKTEQSLRGLRNSIGRAYEWAKPAMLYPKIRNLTWWAMDATGVTQPVFETYMQRHCLQALLAAGYPPNKMEYAIRRAYITKKR